MAESGDRASPETNPVLAESSGRATSPKAIVRSRYRPTAAVHNRRVLDGEHSTASSGGASVGPVATNMGIVGVGTTFAGFHQRLQAHQIDRPLGTAMVHEFDRLLPTLVLEENDGMVACLFEIETYFCADPFLGSLDHLP